MTPPCAATTRYATSSAVASPQAPNLPDCGSRSPRWFCIQTHARDEFRALRELEAQQYRTYLPLWLEQRPDGGERIAPMFPGYLFVEFDPTADRWRPIVSTRGVLRLFSASAERPIPVPHGVVEGLISRTSARRVVDDPGQDRGVVYFAPGTPVMLTEGAFAGREGIFDQSAGKRLEILLETMGRQIRVLVGPKQVRAI